MKQIEHKTGRPSDGFKNPPIGLALLQSRFEHGHNPKTITITQAKKERLARDLECEVAEIDELLQSGVLDTPGVTYTDGE